MCLHQLEVVDHDQRETLLPLETAALGPDVGHRDNRGIVDVDRRLVHPPRGIDDKIRWTISSLDISREKIATGSPCAATLVAMLSARELLWTTMSLATKL